MAPPLFILDFFQKNLLKKFFYVVPKKSYYVITAMRIPSVTYIRLHRVLIFPTVIYVDIAVLDSSPSAMSETLCIKVYF